MDSGFVSGAPVSSEGTSMDTEDPAIPNVLLIGAREGTGPSSEPVRGTGPSSVPVRGTGPSQVSLCTLYCFIQLEPQIIT
ncbi:hypothetical protein CesoFtcFv8_019418 [Champsocephalus esox]|uniref:Uncharacterized protein n=1 Tax=Champsocephalus esox TaxID=159716 RepID=A0AAN8BD76_9TELE|nr:hypothetical protein CesoFtcFv8_019418 [Champsocephalus esox]